MRNPIRLCRRALLVGTLLSLFVPAGAQAVQQEVRLLLDLDNDAATGCTVSTGAGPFAGVEQILITTVDTTSPPDAGNVTDVALSTCTDPGTDTFGAPTSFDGGWPVGIGNGVGGRDVVETYTPLASLVISDPQVVHLGVVVTDGSGGEQDLLTVDGTPTGAPILLDLRSVLTIPTLGEWGLNLLALLLAVASVALLGRRATVALGALFVFLAMGVAWAACVLDGQTNDWTSADQLATDGQVLFGKLDGGRLCFRVDRDLIFNSPPVAEPDAFTTDEDTVLTGVNVLADNGSGADSDPNSDPISVTSYDVVSAQGASVSITSGGDLTYDPTGAAALQALPAGSSVDDTFTYTIEDPSGASDSATVTVTVSGVNDAPTAVADTFETNEDTPLSISAPGLLMNDSDPDTGDTLSVILDVGPTHASFFSIAPDGSFSYTPAANFNGTDSFTYSASDGTATSSPATVTITIVPVNDAPNAVDDMFMTDEDTPLSIAAPGVLMNDTDPENDPLTVTASDATSTQGATVSVAADGSFSYDPAGAAALQALGAAASVDDTFTYTIEDPSMASDTATVTVHVTGVDDPPVAVNDAATVTEDPVSPVPIDVLGNDTDIDGGPKAVASVTQPANGTVVNNGTDVTYQPDPNYCNDPPGTSPDTFTYTLTPGGDTATATVSVTVTCVNDPPTAGADSFDFIGNTELEVDQDTASTPEVLATTTSGTGVLDNDADTVEGNAIAITSLTVGGCTDSSAPFDCTDAVIGTVHMTANGKFSFVPIPGDTDATESFTYVITDDGTPVPASTTGTVTLHRYARVWYVKNDAGAGGAGGSADPFDTLAEAETASVAGDTIFVYHGDSTTTGQSQGITLKNNQRLLGEGYGLSVAAALNGNPSPTALVPAGTKPKITNTSGDGVTVADITGVEIRGLDIAASSASIHVSTTGATNAGVTITNNAVEGSGAQGIRLVQGSSGKTTADIRDNTISAAGNGLDASTSAGTMELAFDTNTAITSSGAAGAKVDGSAGGTLYVTSFSGDQVAGTTAAGGLSFKSVVFDADPSTSAFTGDTVDGGATVVGSSGDRVAGAGVVLDTVSGDLSFSTLTVWNDGGVGLQAIGGGLFNPAGSGFRLSAPAGSVDTANGAAADLETSTLALSLSSVSCTASGSNGIGIHATEGTFTAPSGSIATSNASILPAFLVDGGSLSATYGGTVTSGTGSNSVVVQNMTGGTVTLSGAVTDSGLGIIIAGNDGSTSVTLSGTQTLTTTSHPAFTATGLGTVTVTDPSSSNAITTTTGDGIKISDVQVGASGVKFTSVDVGDSNAAAPNAANGILLTNVGSNPFTVTAGAIQNVTTRGLDVSGGSGNVSVGASISTTSAGRSVEVTGHAGGTVAVSGAVSDNGLGVNLDSNGGGTIDFTAGLVVSSGTNTGFNATNGGTVNVTGASNTLTTTTASALNVANTNIGSSGLTFQSISSNGGSNAGIVLDTTGTAGGLTVTGSGGDCKSSSANCSGGSIVNKSGNTDGITLNSTTDVNLSHMNVSSNTRNGIYGTGVDGFKLSQCRFVSNADQVSPDEAGIYFVDSTGTDGGAHDTTFDDLLVQNSFENNVIIRNTIGTIANLAVGTSLFTNDGSSTQAGSDFFVDAGGTSNVTVNVTGSELDGSTVTGMLTAFGLVGDAADTSNLTINASSSSFTDNNVAMSASASNGANVAFDLSNNPTVTGNRAIGINVFANANHTGTISGRIVNNVIGTAGTLSSGSKIGEGMEIDNEGGGTVTFLIDGNTVQEVGDGTGTGFEGIYVNQAVTAGTTNATITNNTIDQIRDDRGINAQVVFAGATMCSDISGNTLTNIYSSTPIRVRQNGGTHDVHQLDPAGPADPNRLDTANGLTSGQVSVAGTINFNQGTCPQP